MKFIKGFIFTVFFASFLFSCSKTEKITYNQENDFLIEEISPTFIPRESKIKISFTKETSCTPEDAMTFEPKQKGTWSVSEDKKTFIFTPQKFYKQNAEFSLIADCNKLFGGTETGKYVHPFVADKGCYKINFEEMELDEDTNLFSLKGKITTDIPVPLSKVKKIIKTSSSGTKRKIQWEDNGTVSTSFNFTIGGIKCYSKANSLTISWKGRAIGFSKKMDKNLCGSKTFKIPSDSILDVIDINTSRKNSISISFSKILDKAQNLTGFVKAYGKDGNVIPFTNASVRNNILTVFSDTNFSDIGSVEILEGIKSIDGFHLGNSSTISLSDVYEIPEVRFTSSGVILPTTQGSKVIIETKNLTGLLLQVYAIPERTMYQFLQDNELSEKSNLYRVGEPVFEKHVNLNWDDSMMNRFIPRGIDISELTKKHDYGMYQIRVSFRKKDIKYVCSKGHKDFSYLPFPEDKIAEDTKYKEEKLWNFANDLDYKDRRTFWDFNEDPCHPAFYLENYHPEITAKENIIISDIALSAKKDNDGKLYIAAANLKDTQPVKNSFIELYNYIGKKIAEGKTDDNGIAVFDYSEQIEYITATSGSQTTYLKLSAGTELSISHFETGGVISKDGAKGFIYGERGVWRPGDTMYLTFLLQDKDKKLPDDIPVNFELIDPLGKTVEKKILKDQVNGFYSFETSTSEKAATGLYTAKVSIGGNSWTKGLRVESIVPNKLSVKLTSASKILTAGSNSLKLEGSWLHGASAAGYKADVAVSFSKARPDFKISEGYSFENPLNKVAYKRENIFEGKLNLSSYADINARLESDSKAPGFMNANFVSRIYEPSGTFSTEYTTMKFSPYSRYVGIKLPDGDTERNMLLTDKKHTAQIVCFNADGTPANEAEVTCKVYKVQWKWWWEKDAYTNAGFVEDEYFDEVESKNISIKDGKGTFDFEIKYPSWGRYLILVSDNAGGHSAGKITYIDWPDWTGRSSQGANGSSSMVALTADKKSYLPGETASVTFPSSKNCRALITIEKNGIIKKQEWIETKAETTVYKFKLTADMVPNLYIHVTLTQPHLQTANSLPIRLYGVVPVYVENPESVLEPVITNAQNFEPGRETVISVSEKNGRPMTYTLAIVDEGLLGLTSFHAQNPHDEFYKKEASQLKSWDIYSDVINAYTGNLETLLAIGGSDEINAGSNAKINRFAPVVKFFGPFQLKAGEKKSTAFVMPAYVGAVRAFVVAGFDGAYGVAEKTTAVKSDLMIQSSLPKTLGTNEVIDVPVTVFNGTDKKENVTVEMITKGNLEAAEKKEISLEVNSDGIVYFTLKTKDAGKLELNFKAISSSKKTALQSYDVNVISRGTAFTYTEDIKIKAGSSESITAESPFEKGTKKLTLTMSSVPSINLESRLDYLISYPHGCIEQITSGAFPQLYLADFMNLPEDKIQEIQNNVTGILKKYSAYQLAAGSFAYWQGDGYVNEWGTCYALHFMTEARRKGWTVPENVFTGALDYVYGKSVNWTKSEKASEELEAYRLYVLANAGKADLGTMNRLSDSEGLNDASFALLSSAYSITGNKEKGEKLLKKAVSVIPFFRTTGDIFASSIRDDCLKLLAAVNLDDSVLVSKYSKKVIANLSSKDWMSTQETAWALLSLFASYGNPDKENKSYTASVNGKETKAEFTKAFDVMNLKATETEKQNVIVTNTGSKPLYGSVTSSGILKPGSEVEASGKISLSVNYADEEGIPVNVNSIRHGDNFTMKVTVKNMTDAKIENIALTIPVPTGWELSNDRIGGQVNPTAAYTYMDIKDDRILVYLDLKENDELNLNFNVNCAYSGAYWVPAVSAEAMYDNSINAVLRGTYADTRKEK